jgi:hypothetical protein
MEFYSVWTDCDLISNIVEFGYNVLSGTEYFVVINEECNVMFNSDELIGTAECLTV